MNPKHLLLLAPLALAGCGAPSGLPDALNVSINFDVAPGTERIQCLTRKLHNGDNFDFTDASSQMSAGSHHLILYKDASALTGATPPAEGIADCQMDLPRIFVYGAQTPDHSESMPPGIAGRLEPDTTVILEAHFVNASSTTLKANASVTLTPAFPGTVHDLSGVIFYMDTAFSIPSGAGINGAPDYLHSTTCPVPEGLHIFRMQSHGHHRLTDFEIWQEDLPSSTDLDHLYTSTQWSEPTERTWPDDAPLLTQADQGFRFQCSWTNETQSPVVYGPSAADNEMCIMGAAYWPRVSGRYDGNLFCMDGQLLQ